MFRSLNFLKPCQGRRPPMKAAPEAKLGNLQKGTFMQRGGRASGPEETREWRPQPPISSALDVAIDNLDDGVKMRAENTVVVDPVQQRQGQDQIGAGLEQQRPDAAL